MAQFKNKTEIAIEKQKYWRIEKIQKQLVSELGSTEEAR